MKRGTPRHPKTKALARRLKVAIPHAVGILEMLWHFAGEFAPEGNVGRVSDADIAEAVCWTREPIQLIEALTIEHWLDKDEEYRLIVHDWPDHADDAVRKKLARQRRQFLPIYGHRPDIVATQSGHRPDIGGHTRAEGRGEARKGKAEASLPKLMQSFGDWPKTGAALEKTFPQAASFEFILKLCQGCSAEYTGVKNPQVPFSDEMIAEAIDFCYAPGQKGAGLFLSTVPTCLRSWAKNGRKSAGNEPPEETEAERRAYDAEVRAKLAARGVRPIA